MYRLCERPDKVVRISDGARIPFDVLNKDYQEYLEWLKLGNAPLEREEETENENSRGKE